MVAAALIIGETQSLLAETVNRASRQVGGRRAIPMCNPGHIAGLTTGQ